MAAKRSVKVHVTGKSDGHGGTVRDHDMTVHLGSGIDASGLTPAAPVEVAQADSDENISAILASHDRAMELLTDEDQLDILGYNPAWLEEMTPAQRLAYLKSRTLEVGLSEDQTRYVFDSFRNSLRGQMSKGYLQEPTDEEWAAYLERAQQDILDADNITDAHRAQLLADLEAVRAGGRPDAEAFAILNKTGSRMWRARHDLDYQAVQISSWVDADPMEVKANVARFRDEYYEMIDRGETPDTPEGYFRAFRRTQTTNPKDAATIYAHWRAEDPTLYDPAGLERRYVAFDLETTGISRRDCHIIEIGLVEYDASGRETGRWNQLVRPPVGEDGVLSTGDETVMAVHGITPDDVKDAPSIEQVMSEWRSRMSGATLIGHNLKFDTDFAAHTFRKYAPQGDYAAATVPWASEADTLVYAARHLHAEPAMTNFKLATLAGHVGVPYTNGHRADHDAAVAGEVFFALREKISARRNGR